MNEQRMNLGIDLRRLVTSGVCVTLLLAPAWADVSFSAGPAFSIAPRVASGGGSLVVVPAVPAGLQSIPGGYTYSGPTLTYTTVAADAGSTVIIDWRIERPFTIINVPFIGNTRAAIGGTITAAGGAATADVFEVNNTTHVPGIVISDSLAIELNPGAAFSDSGDSAVFNLGVNFAGDLRQQAYIRIDVPANTPAGATYEITIPSSFDSLLVGSSGAPAPALPPWAHVVLVLTVVATGGALLRRRLLQ